MASKAPLFVQSKVFESIQPVICVARVVGLCPVKYNKSDGKYLIEKSNIWLAWSFILALFLACASIAGVWDDIRTDDDYAIKMNGPLATVVNIVDVTNIITMVLAGVCLSPCKIRHFFFLFEKVNEIDKGIPPKFNPNERKHCLLAIIIIPIWFVCLEIFDIFQWLKLQVNEDALIDYCVHYGTYNILYTIGIIQEAFLWYLVHFLRNRLKNLNGWLEKRKYSLKNSAEINFIASKNKNNGTKMITMSLDEALCLTKIHESICEVIDSLGDLRGHAIFNKKILDTVFRFLNFNLQEDVKKQVAGSVTTYLVILVQFTE